MKFAALQIERMMLIEGVESGTCNRKIDKHRELDVPKAANFAKIVVNLENIRLVLVSQSLRIQPIYSNERITSRTVAIPLVTVSLQLIGALSAHKRVDCPEGTT